MSRASATSHPAGPVVNGEQIFNRVVQVTLFPPSAAVKTGPGQATLNGIVVTGLRVVAKTHKSCLPGPSSAEVSIYNLSKDHRALLNQRNTLVLLAAGYSTGNPLALLFSGNAFFVDHIRAGPDWITKIELMDGGNPYRNARLNQHFGSGTPVSTVVTALANAMGPLSAGTAAIIASIPGVFQRGLTVHGRAADWLTEVLKGRPFAWRFQDGAVVILGATPPNFAAIPVLTPSTGLIGSPEHGTPDVCRPFQETSLTITSLLQPSLHIGDAVEVQSESIGSPGKPVRFTVFGIEDDIDSLGTPGSPWYTKIETTFSGRPPIGAGLGSKR